MAVFSTGKMSNPAIKKLGSLNQSVFGEQANTATYGGVAGKTVYFMLLFVAGMGAYFYIDNYYASSLSGDSKVMMYLFGAMILAFISGLIAGFAPKTCPVTGSIYAASEGFVLTWLSLSYGAAYKGIIVEAISLTVLTILVMAALYASGLVRVTSRFRTVLYTMLMVSIIGGLAFFLFSIFGSNTALYRSMVAMNNGPIGIVFAVIGVAIAAMFLLSDFDTIQQTVERGLDKKYEWYASYGLVLGVIYLYLKILRLLAIIANNRK